MPIQNDIVQREPIPQLTLNRTKPKDKDYLRSQTVDKCWLHVSAHPSNMRSLYRAGWGWKRALLKPNMEPYGTLETTCSAQFHAISMLQVVFERLPQGSISFHFPHQHCLAKGGLRTPPPQGDADPWIALALTKVLLSSSET